MCGPSALPLHSGLQLGLVPGRHLQEIRGSEQSRVGVFVPKALSLQALSLGWLCP